MTEEEIEDLKEIKEMLRQICQVLGIGKVPPASVINLKDRAKQRALEIKRKKG